MLLWEKIENSSPKITDASVRCKRRQQFVSEYSFSVPTKNAIEKIKRFVESDTILEIESGRGLWAKLMQDAGIPVIPTDTYSGINTKNSSNTIHTNNPYWESYAGNRQNYTTVHNTTALESLQRFDTNILMSLWPPEKMIIDILLNFKGNKFIYGGVGYDNARPGTGFYYCDLFYEFLCEQWTEIDTIDIPQWYGINDYIRCYIKRKDVMINKNNTGQYCLGNQVIGFFTGNDEDFNGHIEVKQNTGGYVFEIESSLPVTMVVPSCKRDIIIGDNHEYITSSLVQSYYYKGETDCLDSYACQIIHCPMFHLISGYNSWSFSVSGECKITPLYKLCERYISITGLPHKNVIKFHLDISANYLTNLQRVPTIHNIINTLWSIPEMTNAIYYGSAIINPPDSDQTKKHAERIQEYLDKRGVTTVITGSLAEHLNGIDCPINDCDLMCVGPSEMMLAAELLKELGYDVDRKNEKWIQATIETHVIDLSWDNYRLLQLPYYVEESGGFRFFTTNGLLWLALLNLYELHQMNNFEGYPRNSKALFELMEHAKNNGTICNTSTSNTQLHKYNKNCKKILEIMSNMPILFLDTRVNTPFRINCFGTDNKRIFGVINISSVPTDCRIITDFRPRKAIWQDISGKDQNIKIDILENFSTLYANKLVLPGIVICEN